MNVLLVSTLIVGSLGLSYAGLAGTRRHQELAQASHPLVTHVGDCSRGFVTIDARSTTLDRAGVAHVSYRVTPGIDLAALDVWVETSSGRTLRAERPASGARQAEQVLEGSALVQLSPLDTARSVAVHARYTVATGPGQEPLSGEWREELHYDAQADLGLPSRVVTGAIETIPVPAVRERKVRR